MHGLWRASPEVAELQNKLIFGGGAALLGAGFLLVLLGVGAYFIFGATATACVVQTSQPEYASGGQRVDTPWICYQYFDERAGVLRTQSSYQTESPDRAVGKTFTVEYLPGFARSAIAADEPVVRMAWLIVLAIFGVFWLAWICIRPTPTERMISGRE